MTSTPDQPAGSDQTPYSIDPASERPAPAPPQTKPETPPDPKARIDKPGLISDFDEDADFDRDPELQKVLQGAKPAPAATPTTTVPLVDFVKPGFGEAIHWAAAGGVLLLAALVVIGVKAPDKTVWRILMALYLAVLHTGTGLVAIYVSAALVRQFVGRVDLAAARMFAAVAAFTLVASLRPAFFSSQALNSLSNLTLASIAYVSVVVITFRLWSRRTAAYVVGFHFVLWMILHVALILAAAIARTGGAKP